MRETLKDIIKDQIAAQGPMSVGDFMALALSHPDHGYYMKQDPFGRGGDFTTAPEVSQLFGEMIGAWVADIWQQMGAPSKLIMLECGPGRGTLMADILRATKGVEGFHGAVQVHLLEISPVLKKMQAGALTGHDPQWHESLGGVPDDAPMIVVGNEFLDALPFQQFVNGEERKITVDGDDLVFTAEGDVVEKAPLRKDFVRDICARIKAQTGAALFIDYGYVKAGAGDTFQAVKGHEYVDVLSHVGDADLTSHVDFEALQQDMGAQVHGPIEQGAFLRALGVELRAQMLKSNASPEQAETLEKGLHRLIHSDQMGPLFKVIGFTHDSTIKPAGF